MALVCGIYGYEITRAFTVCGMQFLPILTSHDEAKAAARDLEQYNLTAVVVADDFPGDILFRLEAVLSFIEHLDVVVSQPTLVTEPKQPHNQFPQTIRTSPRHNGGGAILWSDTFFPASRPTFIEKAVQRLGDLAHCEATGYKTLFFKTTETFRQRRPFMEVSYFLLFSGLETYVRKSLIDFKPTGVASLLDKHLRALSFNVQKTTENQPERAMETYAKFRNALFHNSKFEAELKVGGIKNIYQLTDFYYQFLMLVTLVVVKATDFDDGHINWDAWVDRQLFK